MHFILEYKEGQEEDGDSQNSSGAAMYTLTIRSALYPFKDRFDDKGIPGAFVEDASGRKDYARFLQFTSNDEEAKEQVQVMLEDVLRDMPVYFINMVGEDDAVARWFGGFQSVFQAENLEEP
eukprot:Skav216561  [mRNA]  locus=scaffold3255:2313:2866:- [translate_table: standard]